MPSIFNHLSQLLRNKMLGPFNKLMLVCKEVINNKMNKLLLPLSVGDAV